MGREASWTGNVEPDYGQFYLRRAGAEWASDKVPQEGYRDGLWSTGEFVYVGTYRKFGPTAVDIGLYGEPLGVPSREWQHVAEVSLAVGGSLEVLGWAAEEPVGVVPLPADCLRMRVHWKGLVAGRFEGVDEQGESDEEIAIALWSAPLAPPEVVRRWDGWPDVPVDLA